MNESPLPAEWAHVADVPLSDLAPRRVLADHWEEAGDPAGPALRELCDFLDGRLKPEAFDACPSALHRAARALFTPFRPRTGLRRIIRNLVRPVVTHPITPEQQSMLAVWRHAWLRVALATGPTDEAAARPAVDAAYAAAGLAPPAAIVWVDSPRGLTAACPANGELLDRFQAAAVGTAIRYLEAHLGDTHYGGPWQVPVSNRMLSDALYRPEGAATGHHQIGPQFQDVLHGGLGFWCRSWSAEWLTTLSFWYAVAGLHGLDHLAGLWRLAELAYCLRPYRDVAVLIRRPVKIGIRPGEPTRLLFADGHREDDHGAEQFPD